MASKLEQSALQWNIFFS